VSAEQTLTLDGQDINTKSSQTRELKTSAGRRMPDGTIQMDFNTTALKATLSLPGNVVIDYDSEKADQPDVAPPYSGLVDLLQLAAKARWSATYGADNRAISVQVPENLLKPLDVAMRKLVEQQFDPDRIKTALNDDMNILPDKPVTVGQTWERTHAMQLEANQTLTFKSKYTYEGTVDQDGMSLDKISTKAMEVTYDMTEGLGGLTLKSSKLKIDDEGGVVLFDRQKGQLVTKDSTYPITGSLSFDLGGTELTGQLKLTLETKQVNK
jgi:hypothetical protein